MAEKVEKKNVVIEGTIKDGGSSEVAEQGKPKKVVNTPKANKGGRTLYSGMTFEELLKESKARGLESQVRGLNDSPEGRRRLRAILKKDDEERGVKPHVSHVSGEVKKTNKTTKVNKTKTTVETAPQGIPWWIWALVLIAAALLLWGIFRPRPTATVDLTSLQTSIGQLSTKVDALGQSVADLAGRVTALEASAPTEEPVDTSDAVIPDTVQKFRDLGAFYIDGDQFIENWKVQGAQMKYTCKSDFGVFITMDPGVVNGQSTGDLGAVFFVACKKGGVVTISTPHWSTSSLHQQIHLVEFTQEISENQAISFLKVLKADEGKQVAFFIDAEGKVTKY